MSVSDQFERFEILKLDNGHATHQEDSVAVEEPLELRIAGDTIATTMRTPGDDAFLAQGFFYNEGFINDRSQVGDVFHCGRTGETGYGNTIELMPAPGVMLNFEHKKGYKRGTLVNSACGVCGREQIDDLLKRCTPFHDFNAVNTNCVKKCLTQLSSHQSLFEHTGGVHAAASFTDQGDLLSLFEDVGRHNATDKVIGRLFEQDQIGKGHILTVSGRISFEIVQKAAVSRHPVVIGISAPTSLAVHLAQSLKMTLIAFARGNRWSIFTHNH